MTDMLPGVLARQLEGVDAALWQVAQSQILAMASAYTDGTLTEETLAGGLAAFAQLPLDSRKVLDAIHLPEDAGEHAAALEQILRRIPDGWGRWIGCDAGRYPLLVELDRHIAALLPYYEIHQVKEKYGTLRFYWGIPEREPACCTELAQQYPRPDPGPVSGPFVPKYRTAEAQKALDAWIARVEEHLFSSEHAAGSQALQEGPEIARQAAAVPRVEALVRAAEEHSAIVCELCGDPGALHFQGGWSKTLCAACGTQLDYRLADRG